MSSKTTALGNVILLKVLHFLFIFQLYLLFFYNLDFLLFHLYFLLVLLVFFSVIFSSHAVSFVFSPSLLLF